MWEMARKYRRWLAVLVATLLIAAAWTGTRSLGSANDSWLAIFAIAVNLASTVIAFLVVSLLFDRENLAQQKELLESAITSVVGSQDNQLSAISRAVGESLNRPEILSQVQWSKLIDDASEIDFIVQGWDGWADREDVATSLTAFFGRGGVFRLYICNPEDLSGSLARQLMEKRLSRSPGEILAEIRGTVRKVTETLQLCNGSSPGHLEIIETSNVNWYFAASFKGRDESGQGHTRDVMVFSVYSHTPRRPWSMPAALIYPDMYRDSNTYDWFAKELIHLRAEATTRCIRRAETIL